MVAEESFLEAMAEEDVFPLPSQLREKRHERLNHKNQAAIDEFLGSGSRIYATGILPRYYGELLTWALWRYLEREGWKICVILGYHGPEPVYTGVNTGDEKQNLLMDGQMLIEKADDRYTVTVEINPRFRGSVQIEGPAERKQEMGQFIVGVLAIAKEENFYRGKKIEFAGRIRILDVKDRAWDSIVLDAGTKAEIEANTVGFLKQRERWSQYGIPAKRGVLLAGEPGTGKTVICKALMAEAAGMTCITTNGYALDSDDYLTELYELAEDLSPSMVFIEDIDLIGQNREEFGYQRGPALLSLLAVLDGIEERNEIVTIATTNCLEALDKALSQRPSRFDRVIKLRRPGFDQRRKLVGKLCRKIPLDDRLQEYIAHGTEGCTPAQVQEVIHSLVIERSEEKPDLAALGDCEVDHILSRLNGRGTRRMGFCASANHNGHAPEISNTARTE